MSTVGVDAHIDPQELGIDLSEAFPEFEHVDTLELTFMGVMSEIWDMLKGEIMKPLKLLISLIGVILLCALAQTLRDGSNTGEGSKSAFELVGVLAGAGLMSAAIAECVVRAGQTLTAAGAFLLTFVPILAGILAVMGHLSSANLFNTAVIAAAQVFSQVMATALMPLCASVLGVSIAGAVSPDLKTERFANAVKTVVVWVLGFSATIFSGLLTVQSLVTGSADSAAMRAVRFTVSGGVPIVGGAVSDALGVLNGSMGILKNSTGAFGIIAIGSVCLPVLLSVICFRLALTIAAAVSDMFGVTRIGSLIKSSEKVMSIILAMLICFMMITIISIALMIRIGGGI